MINKKNFLGSAPVELGVKDALHVAIVSMRAATSLQSGQRVKVNEFGEVVGIDGKRGGIGVVDPFRKEEHISRGEYVWICMLPDQVGTVMHTWDHETLDLDVPTREAKKNEYLQRCADDFGVSYKELLDACSRRVYDDVTVPHPRGWSVEKVEEQNDHFDWYDLWYEWVEETGYEFYNEGTECCPEYDYPYDLFRGVDED